VHWIDTHGCEAEFLVQGIFAGFEREDREGVGGESGEFEEV